MKKKMLIHLLKHYKYCKILNKVITAAKKMAYDNYCVKTHDTMKYTWRIINIETGRTTKRDDTCNAVRHWDKMKGL
jgi:hypothetical protein